MQLFIFLSMFWFTRSSSHAVRYFFVAGPFFSSPHFSVAAASIDDPIPRGRRVCESLCSAVLCCLLRRRCGVLHCDCCAPHGAALSAGCTDPIRATVAWTDAVEIKGGERSSIHQIGDVREARGAFPVWTAGGRAADSFSIAVSAERH